MPRIAIGQYLREHRLASSMIDLSDGLSTDLSHICEESRVGAVVQADSLPTIDRLAREVSPTRCMAEKITNCSLRRHATAACRRKLRAYR